MSTTEELHDGEEMEKQPNEVIHHKETVINGIKVLPTCDTLDEPTQLDRNNKTFVDMSTPEPEQGTYNKQKIRRIVNVHPHTFLDT